MDKIINLLTKFFDKTNNGLVGLINGVGDIAILIVSKLSESVFVVGGALANKASGLLGVAHDNIGRTQDVLSGKRGGNGTDGTPTA
jgi:hypothetical protein